MTLLWLLYATVVATLLGLAALGAERALRLAGRPGRGPWVGAVLGSWYLALRALLRPGSGDAGGAAGLDELLILATAGGTATGTKGAVSGGVRAWLSGFWEPGFWTSGEWTSAVWAPWIGAPWAEAVIDLLVTPLPWLPLVWAGLATLALLALAGAVLSLVRRVRAWPPARIQGVPVRIAPDFGPALVGFIRPRIVLPRWSLGLAPAELRLVLTHEEEHRRAGDTLLLAAATLSAVAAPWNLALWWQLHRLRMAVEVDCDRRVLRSGAPPRAYGSLLVAVGERIGRVGLPATALAERSTFLEERLRRMTPARRGGRWWRAGGAALLGCGVVAAACETPVPTRPADALAEPSGASVGAPGPGAPGAPTGPDGVVDLFALGAEGDAEPIVFVDGVRADGARGVIAQLDTDRIERIEILKGEAARALHGEEGSGGAILIETKDAGELRSDAREGGSAAPRTAEPGGWTYRATAVSPGPEGAEKQPRSIVVRELPEHGTRPGPGPTADTIRVSMVGPAEGIEPVKARFFLEDPTVPVLVDGAEWTGSGEDLVALPIRDVEILDGSAALRALREARLPPDGRDRVLRIRTR